MLGSSCADQADEVKQSFDCQLKCSLNLRSLALPVSARCLSVAQLQLEMNGNLR